MPTALLAVVAIAAASIVASSLANFVASRHQTASNYAVAMALVQVAKTNEVQAKAYGEQAKGFSELKAEVRAAREPKARITAPMVAVEAP